MTVDVKRLEFEIVCFYSDSEIVLVFQSCPILCTPLDSSLPGCSVHGILQARILEWIAIPSSRGSSQPTLQADSFPAELPGKPQMYVNLLLIHVDIWQKPTQYCKAIILQLKINKIFLNK